MVCGDNDLTKECSNDPSKLSSAMRLTCQMCYPTRNEGLIQKHCTKRRRRELEVLYVLCAILITLIVAAAFLVILQDFRRRNRAPDREISQNRLTKNWSLRLVKLPTLSWTKWRPTRKLWPPGFLQSFSRRRAPLDVEGDPAWFDADAYVRKHDSPQSPWYYLDDMQNHPRAAVQNRGISDTLKLRKVGRRHPVEERVPVMPPAARSSSVQLPPTSADPGSQGALRNLVNGGGSAHQPRHFATIHTISPTQRATIPREMSRTMQ